MLQLKPAYELPSREDGKRFRDYLEKKSQGKRLPKNKSAA
jgi:hypothetical protein